MSLEGKAKAGAKLKGRINQLKMIQGYSAYEVAVINGFEGTEEEWLTSITAYGEAVKNGFKGTVQEWLIFLSAYGVACKNGFKGTEAEWLISLSSYGVACKNGFVGSEEDWLISLTAYGIAVKNGFEGTEEDWLKSLYAPNIYVEEAVVKYLEEHPAAIDDTLTRSGEAADAKVTGDALNKKVDYTDIVDDLNSDDAKKPLSAKQGKALNDTISGLRDTVSEKAVTETYKGTFASGKWGNSVPFTQTITVNGVLSTDYPFVDIDLSGVSNAQSVIEAWNLVGRVTVTADNTVIAYCYEEAPTVNIPIVLKVVR